MPHEVEPIPGCSAEAKASETCASFGLQALDECCLNLAETAVDDPLHKDLAQIATAFRCQQEGLTSLIEFFATGDKQALGRARTGIASGRRMAESLEQTARGRR